MSLDAIPILPAPDCSCECRPVALVRDGVLLGLEGEDGAPPCDACLAAAFRAQDPARLTQPLRARGIERDAARAEEMDPAPWDEVVDRVAFLLAEAARGQRRVVWISCGGAPRLLQAVPRRIGRLVPDLTLFRRQPPRERLGRLLDGMLYPDERAGADGLKSADLIVAWGADPRRGPPSLWFAASAAVERGAKLVVVDPRASASAREGTLHLPLRPATDVALAMTLVERLRPTSERAASFPALLNSALSEWPTARGAEVCGLAPRDVERLAGWLAEAKQPALLLGGGLARQPEALMAVHAVVLLARSAKALIVGPSSAPDPSLGVLLPNGSSSAREAEAGALDRELAAREPRHDLVIVEGGDPLDEFPAGGGLPGYLRQAGFIVTLADVWSRCCALSDIVLPVAAHVERGDAAGLRWPPTMRLGRPALPPRRDARTDAAVWRAVAKRVGWPERWFPADPADLAREVSAYGVPTFRLTGLPGRWEPPVFREAGEGPRSAPDQFRVFKLLLTRGEWHLPIGVFPSGPPPLLLNPADAAARGLSAGRMVVVHNERARLLARAVLDPAQPPGVVVLPERWPVHRGRSVNELLPPQRFEGDGEAPEPCLVDLAKP